MKKKYKRFMSNFSDEFLNETRRECKCGHTVNFVSKIPYIICNHCGRLIFKDKKAEYDYRIKRKFGIQKENKNGNK